LAAVNVDNVGAPALRVLDPGDVAKVDDLAAVHEDGDLGEVLRCLHHRVGGDVIILPLDAHLAGGDDLALVVDDASDVHVRHLHRFEGARVDVDLHLAEDAAEDGSGGQALQTGQLVAQLVVGEVEQIAVVARVAGNNEVADGHGGGVVLHDGRRQHPRRQVLQFAGDEGDDLAGGQVGIDDRAEVDLDDADAQQRARLDVVEVVALGQGAFEDGGDGLLHVRRRHAAVGGKDDDNRHLDVG